LARLKGSVSSKEAKTISKEIEQIQGSSYRYNFDFLRLIELLISYKIAESVAEYEKDTPLDEMSVTVEIPLIGELEITPRYFHEKHRLTDEPSLHFDFNFTPTSAFKSDVMRAFTAKDCDLKDVAASIYSDRLQELYKRFQNGE
jgi:hypothetical protein